ncbi:MAG: cobalamin B12-binding domain-containing protein [Deltaproteobacteria bacterium]|nr:cobalamin B12-binding domain-containing protein [Deltaproteobacteria bacterium]
MRVVLCAGTPAEHAIGSLDATGSRDFAADSYSYAIGLLKACALADPDVAAGLEIGLKEFPVGRSQLSLIEEQLQEILAERPDVVGFSTYCWSLDLFLDAAARLRRELPELLIVMGGPSVSHEARALLEAHPQVDIIVRGEGELAFAALCRQRFRAPAEVPNVACRGADGRVSEHPAEDAPEDLSALPSPYLTRTLRPRARSLLIEPSRGCRFRCGFCSWSTRAGQLRYQQPARIAQEIRWAREHGYRGVNFCDTAVNHDTGQLRSLCDTIRAEDPEGRLSLSLFLRHEELDAEQLEILARIRCDEIIMGLESTNAAALRACGKPPLDPSTFEEKLAGLRAAGHRVTLSIMSGLPDDSLAGFASTLEYLEGLLQRQPDAVNFVCCFWLAVLPGTRFAELRERYGFRIEPRGTPYLLESRDWSPEELEAAARLLVEKAQRDPRFRCEEIHRAVVAMALGETAVAHAAGELAPQEALLRPWRVGETRGGWVLVEMRAAPPSEGLATACFEPAPGTPGTAIHVTIAARDDRRPAFAQTRSHSVYYRGRPRSHAALEALGHLLEQVVELIGANET